MSRVGLVGLYRVYAVQAGGLRLLHEARNSFTAAGRAEIAALVGGVGGTAYDATAELKVTYTEGSGYAAQITGTIAGYPQLDDSAGVNWVKWRWQDGPNAIAYSPKTLEVYNGAGVQLNSLDVSGEGWGQKPTTATWVYEYTLQFAQSGTSPYPTDGVGGGFNALGRMVGAVAGLASALGAIDMRLEVTAGGSVHPLSGPAVVVDGTSTKYTWHADAGAIPFQWDSVVVDLGVIPDGGDSTISATSAGMPDGTGNSAIDFDYAVDF